MSLQKATFSFFIFLLFPFLSFSQGVDSIIFNLQGKSDEYVVIPVKGIGFCLFYNGLEEWQLTVFDSSMKEIKKSATGISSKMPILVHDRFETRVNVLFGQKGFATKKRAKPKAGEFKTHKEMKLLSLDIKDLSMVKTDILLPYSMIFRDFKSLKDHSIIAGDRSANVGAQILQVGTGFATFGITWMLGVRFTTNRTSAFIITHEQGDIKEVALDEKGHDLVYSLDKNVEENLFIINQINKNKKNKYNFFVKTVDVNGKLMNSWVKKNTSRRKVGGMPYDSFIFPGEDTSYRIGMFSLPFSDSKFFYSNQEFKKSFESGGLFVQPLVGNQKTRAVFIYFKRFHNLTRLPDGLELLNISRTDQYYGKGFMDKSTYYTDMTAPNFLIESIRINKERQYIFSGQVYYPQLRESTSTNAQGEMLLHIEWNQWSVRKGFFLTLDQNFKLVHDTSFNIKSEYQRKPEALLQTSLSADSTGVQTRYVNDQGKIEISSYTPGNLRVISQLNVSISDKSSMFPLTDNSLLVYELQEDAEGKRKLILKLVAL